MSIDAIFLSIGELGKQQCIYGGLLCLLNGLAAFHMLQYTFVSFDVDFTCSIPGGQNYSNECPENSVSACSDVFFFTQQRSSIVSEWSLVCDQSYKSKATMSAFMAGVMIGAFVLGKFADQYGRKICLSSTTLGILVFNTLSALVPSYKLYLLTKFSVGFFQAGFILASFVLSNELVGPSKRGLVSMIFQSSFSLFIVVLSFLAYYLQHWRRLTLIISVFGAPALALNFIIPESPRWLLSKNRKREALKVLKDIAAGNGSVFTEKMKLEIENSHPGGGEKSDKNYQEGLLDLFRTVPLSLVTLTQIYSWFVNSGAYYGLTLAAGSAGGNLYTATALSGAVEIPAYILANFLLNITGRRKILAGFMVVGGFSCLGIQVLSRVFPALVQSMALLGKLCLAASFAVIYIHSGEIFPTTIRNSAMGLVSVAARVGGIMAPFIVSLGNISPNLQFTVFGLMSLTAGILNLKLPETKGAQLPETVAELMMTLQGRRITETKHDNLDMEASGLLSDQSDD